ncbi:MAG: WbqC family protein [Cyclobacteriaceae bacterium]|jgi:hypothetical protein|nr:WbqC family protein [Cyclobacteriaceae bacterium]MDH4296200.1 WbqC family protein [Cyclobacteriaceae bacterium]MDH5250705.1 WbqC family protein [Cyclobacteriaceae bacterium]
MTALIETHYLPSIAYFAAIQGVPEITLEKHENYVKQTYRNRCNILSAQGKKNLIVPLTFKHGKVLITDVRVDYGQNWLKNHLRSIQTAYGKAPFFEHYREDLEKALLTKPVYLYDLNYKLLSMCLKWLNLDVTIRESLAYEKLTSNDVLDLRSAIMLKKTENIQYFYRPESYQQVFGNTFAANLSVIDLVFCEGPGAVQVVRASAIAK